MNEPDRGRPTQLERRYRRRLLLFPRAWRSEHGDDLVATFLDGAGPDATRVGMADTLDLLLAAVRLRLRALVRGLRRLPSVRSRRAAVAVAGSAVVGAAIVSSLLGAGTAVPPEFLATSLVVVLIPGTGVVYTVSSAIGGGWPRGFAAAVGCTLGIVPHMLAAMLGLSGVMQAGAVAFEVVRWAGVAYLAYMGLSMLATGGALTFDAEPSTAGTFGVIRRGVLLNLLNPKLTVFFFAFLPQFLDAEPRVLDPRLVLLGGVFMAMTLVIFLGYASTSAAMRRRVLDSPAVVRLVQRSLGVLLVGFAARLATADR